MKRKPYARNDELFDKILLFLHELSLDEVEMIVERRLERIKRSERRRRNDAVSEVCSEVSPKRSSAR